MNTRRTCLVSIFFVLKNTNNTEFREHKYGVHYFFTICSQEQFSKLEIKQVLNVFFSCGLLFVIVCIIR